MSLKYLATAAAAGGTVGSILHGAYGDYYEQIICLRHLKRCHPQVRLILFFASESRRKEMAVFDLSFADEVLSASDITQTQIDRFVQFQIFDQELNAGILACLPPHTLELFDRTFNLKPWACLRDIHRTDPAVCDIPLSESGTLRMGQCWSENGVQQTDLTECFSVGFLWRHRSGSDFIAPKFQTPEEVVHRTKSELLSTLVTDYRAKIIVAGMNVKVTDENRERTDCKYTQRRLDIPEESCVYLKGLNWGLELEIMRHCKVCILMPSGFSEALAMKRVGATFLVDPPAAYWMRLLGHRMPFFNAWNPRNLMYYCRQPHTAKQVLRHIRSFLPLTTP